MTEFVKEWKAFGNDMLREFLGPLGLCDESVKSCNGSLERTPPRLAFRRTLRP